MVFFIYFDGCRRVFCIALTAVIIFSFFAYMLACDWGKVKVSELAIDSRGSVMKATMYTPRNVSAGGLDPGGHYHPRIELQPQRCERAG